MAAKSSQSGRPGATRAGKSSQPGRQEQPDRASRSQIEPARAPNRASQGAQLQGSQASSSNFDMDIYISIRLFSYWVSAGPPALRSSFGCVLAPSCISCVRSAKKKCALLVALRSGCVFSLELGRRTSILLARAAPGTPRRSIFEAETAVFSILFFVRQAHDAKNVRSAENFSFS